MAKQKKSNQKLPVLKILKHSEIEILSEREVHGTNVKGYEYILKPLDLEFENDYNCYIGIDPGSKNIGVSVLTRNFAVAIELRMNDKLKLDSVATMELLRTTIEGVLFNPPYVPERQIKAMVEGSSYGDAFGQVKLAEARTSLIFGLLNNMHHEDVYIRQPSAIRKAVFGNGFVRGEDVYANIRHNAAASLVCAISAEYL